MPRSKLLTATFHTATEGLVTGLSLGSYTNGL
jgi:hypothetical protein